MELIVIDAYGNRIESMSLDGMDMELPENREQVSEWVRRLAQEQAEEAE